MIPPGEDVLDPEQRVAPDDLQLLSALGTRKLGRSAVSTLANRPAVRQRDPQQARRPARGDVLDAERLAHEAARTRDLPAARRCPGPRGTTLGFPTPWHSPGRTGRRRLPCTRTAGCFHRTAARPGAVSLTSSRAGANWWAPSGRAASSVAIRSSNGANQRTPVESARHRRSSPARRCRTRPATAAGAAPAIRRPASAGSAARPSDGSPRAAARMPAGARAPRPGGSRSATGSVPTTRPRGPPATPLRTSSPNLVWRSLRVEERERRRDERLVAQGRAPAPGRAAPRWIRSSSAAARSFVPLGHLKPSTATCVMRSLRGPLEQLAGWRRGTPRPSPDSVAASARPPG